MRRRDHDLLCSVGGPASIADTRRLDLRAAPAPRGSEERGLDQTHEEALRDLRSSTQDFERFPRDSQQTGSSRPFARVAANVPLGSIARRRHCPLPQAHADPSPAVRLTPSSSLRSILLGRRTAQRLSSCSVRPVRRGTVAPPLPRRSCCLERHRAGHGPLSDTALQTCEERQTLRDFCGTGERQTELYRAGCIRNERLNPVVNQ